MARIRTDLALESLEDLGGPEQLSQLEGVSVAAYTRQGCPVTDVRIRSEAGASRLEKPPGRYITIDLRPCLRQEPGFFTRAATCLAHELRTLLPGRGPDFPVLVAGLGNRAMTADAVGPLALESLLVTRHMIRTLPRQFQGFTPVSAVAPGVLADTGMETQELLRGAVSAVRPTAVIAIDALAARSRHRLCATLQLGSTGLIPGSGVGNHRSALNAETLGVPVIAVGTPTVIAASHLGDDTEEPLFLTPRDIDSRVHQLSRLLGYGITLALHENLTLPDITALLG